MKSIIEVKIDKKVYCKRKSIVEILNDFHLLVRAGEKVAIVGESGVGKSSLLNILGLIDKQYAGSYYLFGRDTASLSTNELAEWRNEKIGFVLQESALINSLTIKENIELPFLYARDKKKLLQNYRKKEIADIIGINSILHKKPLECSGGEKARAVFARAVAMNPEIILADEPAASLDSANKERILSLLFELNQVSGTTILTVTHDFEVANRHDRIIYLERKS